MAVGRVAPGEIGKRESRIFTESGYTSWRLEKAVERSQARERAQGRVFSRRTVNARFRNGEHLDLMHQQW